MSKQPTIKEQLEALQNTPSKPIVVAKDAPKATERLKVPVVDLLINQEKSKKGGKQPGAGRPPKEETLVMRSIRAYMDAHANEEVDITVTDPKTGQKRVVKKPRAVILLEILFKKAFENKDVAAINAWLDRAVGKPTQPIRGDGDSDAPIRLEHDISSIIAKAYGNATDDQ